MTRIRTLFIGAALMLTPVLAACGGSSDDPDPTPTATQPPAATATIFAVTTTATPQATATEATTANPISTGTDALDRIGAVIDTGTTPWSPAAGFGSIWLSIAVDGVSHVARFDPATGEVIATISLDALPAAPGPHSPRADVVIGAEGVWASGWRGTDATSADGVLVLIDPETNAIARTLELPIAPRSLAVDDAHGTIWASSNVENRVVCMDTESGEVLAKIDVAVAERIELVPDALWVSADDNYGTLTRIDLATYAVVDRVLNGPVYMPGLTYGAGSLWISAVSSDVVGEVQRLDPVSGTVIARIPMSGP
ncbi:MAG TPA: hypothetical protein VFV93_03365, partial [Thermomicrobiales bacterium]|nr:hypothetical protein [Thermomicrobiales bacterium]